MVLNITVVNSYMMQQKALLFNDEETAEKIMNEPEPLKQKRLGREVKNFNKDTWDKSNFQIVYKVNYAKYSQNEGLKGELLSLGNRILVEASPDDRIWGIGLHENDYNVHDPINWKGQNLLGFAITLVKQQLLSGN